MSLFKKQLHSSLNFMTIPISVRCQLSENNLLIGPQTASSKNPPMHRNNPRQPLAKQLRSSASRAADSGRRYAHAACCNRGSLIGISRQLSLRLYVGNRIDSGGDAGNRSLRLVYVRELKSSISISAIWNEGWVRLIALAMKKLRDLGFWRKIMINAELL
ncbi:hypothetical protein U1Q18_036186 [Sarracenia purpurea var. burkii]